VIRRTPVRHVEGDREHAFAVACREVGELRRIARGGDEIVAGGEHRFGERAAQAT